MRYGLILSAALHVTAILLAVLGVLPGPSPVIVPPQPIPVDIVDIGEITNTRIDEKMPEPRPVPAPAPASAKPPPSAEVPPPEPLPEPPPEPPAAPRVPEPPVRVAEAAPPREPSRPRPPEPPPEPSPEPPPPPEPEAPEPEPVKSEMPEPEVGKPVPPRPQARKPEPPKQEAKKPEPPKPESPKQEPPKQEAKKPEPERPDFQRLLKDLTEREEEPRPPAREQQAAEAPSEPSQSIAPRLSDRLSVSEMDALRRQISSCWSIDPGLPNVREMSVEIRVRISRDRVVEQAEVVDAGRMRSDSVFRSVAESARRALRNPSCSPLELPPDRFETWRDAVFVFSPRDVL